MLSSYKIMEIENAEYLNKINFWKRLKLFVSEVQVNDPMSDEEKNMIIDVCDKFLKEKNEEKN